MFEFLHIHRCAVADDMANTSYEDICGMLHDAAINATHVITMSLPPVFPAANAGASLRFLVGSPSSFRLLGFERKKVVTRW